MTEFEVKIRERIGQLKFGFDAMGFPSDGDLIEGNILNSERITELAKLISKEIGRPIVRGERVAANFRTISTILQFVASASGD